MSMSIAITVKLKFSVFNLAEMVISSTEMWDNQSSQYLGYIHKNVFFSSG